MGEDRGYRNGFLQGLSSAVKAKQHKEWLLSLVSALLRSRNRCGATFQVSFEWSWYTDQPIS